MLGLIGKKVGMTQIFQENGVVVPVTVIQFESNYVIGKKTVKRDGYDALIMGSVDLKNFKVLKPVRGQYKNLENIVPKKYVIEFRDLKGYDAGDEIKIDVFKEIKYVDVTGTTKGKGFQGAMKRHNFSGGPSSHGSKFHRHLGGTGQATTPARTFKGTKMAGRMGGEQQTIQNLEVILIDVERRALLVKGAVPGFKGSFVIVKKARKVSV
ncbi:50S ribosomal protein L3 [Borrelia sp. A-FGy1]|uniref:50S ribosomal protein L3 n=1 Tax=Borrelia sp. A-FGy1 TaxID=2608247 RepID=UPI0015F65CF0|nr:50S ribosomal protein L3 [Borrelia sp. A-FGy1]QMU99251.1 50S ribosomal protein L3 [Borrelia sp. A-FGy1]